MFLTHRNLANLVIVVMDKATVDAQGVIESLLRRPCKHDLYLFGYNGFVYMGLPKVVLTGCGMVKFAWAFCGVVVAT